MSQDMSRYEEEQHEYRHRVEIHLSLSAVSSLQSSGPQFAVDTVGASLPYLLLKQGQNSNDVARTLFIRLTGTASSWLPIRQVGTFHYDDAVIILYAVVMAETVPLTDISVQWLDFQQLNLYPKLATYVGHACNAYKLG